LECVHVTLLLKHSDLHYGFKKHSSCSDEIFTFNEFVRYSIKHGGCIRCAALDATKASEKLLHDGLFHKMLMKGVLTTFVKILMY